MVPKISVVTVTLNAEKTLQDCIESVLSQSVPVEHIIVDGESIDGTKEIIAKYQNQLGGILVESDNGIYDAMNKGIKLANNDIVGILNADDFYPDTNTLYNVLSVFNDSSILACYGDLKYVRFEDTMRVVRYWKAGKYSDTSFKWGWMPPHPTFFVRREVYEKYGLFNTTLGSSADYEFMLRVLYKNKIKAHYIDKTLVHMRVGGISNESFSSRIRANIMDKKAWQINNLEFYPWTFYAKPLRKLFQWIV